MHTSNVQQLKDGVTILRLKEGTTKQEAATMLAAIVKRIVQDAVKRDARRN